MLRDVELVDGDMVEELDVDREVEALAVVEVLEVIILEAVEVVVLLEVLVNEGLDVDAEVEPRVLEVDGLGVELVGVGEDIDAVLVLVVVEDVPVVAKEVVVDAPVVVEEVPAGDLVVYDLVVREVAKEDVGKEDSDGQDLVVREMVELAPSQVEHCPVQKLTSLPAVMVV